MDIRLLNIDKSYNLDLSLAEKQISQGTTPFSH